MIFFFRYIMRRAFQNMRGNLFPNLTTIGIIGISMLIFSAFSLIAYNLSSFLKIWEDKIVVIAYLKKGTPLNTVEGVLKSARQLEGVEAVHYISPFDAMALMEGRLGGQKNLLQGIQPGVLPASLEIQLKKEYRNPVRIQEVISQLKQFSQVDEIQYGQEWVATFTAIVHILQLIQWSVGGLLLIGMILIISNTLQLTIASRREEIEIMHVLGASPAFIRVPFYMEGLIQGLLGAGVSLLFLFLLYRGFSFNIPSSIQVMLTGISILFLPPGTILWILAGGMVLGLFGSFVASMRFLKYSE